MKKIESICQIDDHVTQEWLKINLLAINLQSAITIYAISDARQNIPQLSFPVLATSLYRLLYFFLYYTITD